MADHLRASPEIVWEELGEQIDALIEALVDARLQLEGPQGATRRDIILDLYDEELASKRDAFDHGGFATEEFWDAVIARRKDRMGISQ
ncbi:MAG: hypothetical protein KF883_00495 [Thermomicrobiales bacterium]|nr:hypothetical protein [Thermomicrobiales bacterium]